MANGNQFNPVFLAMGIALGAGIGAAMDNIAIGVGIGVALGAGLAVSVGSAPKTSNRKIPRTNQIQPQTTDAPHPSRRGKNAAKRPETIKWADDRASFSVVPKSVMDQWGIDLEKERAW